MSELHVNGLLAFMQAIANGNNAGSLTWLSDGESTRLDIGIEQQEYNDWQKKLDFLITNTDPAKGDRGIDFWVQYCAAHQDDKGAQGALAEMQTKFQKAQTQMQTETQQADGGTQAMQTQDGQDATTASQRAGLATAAFQVGQSLSSLLGSNY